LGPLLFDNLEWECYSYRPVRPGGQEGLAWRPVSFRYRAEKRPARP